MNFSLENLQSLLFFNHTCQGLINSKDAPIGSRPVMCSKPSTFFLILMDPCIVDYSVEIPTRCSFVIEFIIPKFFAGSTCFEQHTAHHQEL
jgi:hypothetical protein